jgi:hypothetical protein
MLMLMLFLLLLLLPLWMNLPVIMTLAKNTSFKLLLSTAHFGVSFHLNSETKDPLLPEERYS